MGIQATIETLFSLTEVEQISLTYAENPSHREEINAINRQLLDLENTPMTAGQLRDAIYSVYQRLTSLRGDSSNATFRGYIDRVQGDLGTEYHRLDQIMRVVSRPLVCEVRAS